MSFSKGQLKIISRYLIQCFGDVHRRQNNFNVIVQDNSSPGINAVLFKPMVVLHFLMGFVEGYIIFRDIPLKLG